MRIRPETHADIPTIRTLTKTAFEPMPYSSGTEAGIIDALRAADALALSLVAVDNDDTILGHIAFSKIKLDGVLSDWYVLGPISVWPAHQGQGIGSALVREGLSQLRAHGANGCVLLGSPEYYQRFGFTHDARLRLPGGDTEYFMLLPFSEVVPEAAVTFHEAFNTQ